MVTFIQKTSLSLSILALTATTICAEQNTYTFNINTGDTTTKKSIIKNVEDTETVQSVKVDNKVAKVKKGKKTAIVPIVKKEKVLSKIEKYNLANNVSKYNSLNLAIEDLAKRLLKSSRINHSYLDEIAVTSFVDLHKFNKTSHFGRSISESFFDELFTRGFNVTDFRGQENLTINEYGEYYLTRDRKLLNKEVKNKYILIGTYSKFEDSILISARIVSNISGNIIASARSYYNTTDCKLLENCPKPRRINIVSHDDYLARKSVATPSNYKVSKNSQAVAIYKKTRSKKISYRSRKNNQISLIN